MSTTPRFFLVAGAALAVAAGAAGCDLTVENPNAATLDEVLSTRVGLIGFANGLQRSYAAGSIDNIALTPGVTAREVAIVRTFASLQELEDGGALLPAENGNVNALFSALYRVGADAQRLIDAADAFEGAEAGFAEGLTAIASFYKAAALGALAQNFERVALQPGTFDAEYSGRQEAFAEAVRLLSEAERLAGVAAGNAAFQDLLPDGFDLVNSARAYRARFALFGGDYAGAIAAVNATDLSATSRFAYGSDAQNPMFNAFYLGTPSYAVRDDLGLPAIQPGDQRVDFYTDPDLGPNADDPGDDDTLVNDRSGFAIDRAAGFFDDGDTAPLPVYIPDELRLIRAEATVRSGGSLAAAIADINAVRTATTDPFGVVAGLPPYAGPVTAEALLSEIYYNRSTELYLQGLRLEDQRRFNRPGPSSDGFQRNRNFYPYPDQERQANPNTPADPAI